MAVAKSHGQRSLVGSVHWVAKSQTRLSNFTFTFHFHALEKEMAQTSLIQQAFEQALQEGLSDREGLTSLESPPGFAALRTSPWAS